VPSFKTLLLACAGLLIGLQILRFVLVMHNLLRTRLRTPGMRLVPADRVPAHVREGLQAPIAELVELGFELRGWVCAERSVTFGGDSLHLAWLLHPREGAYASVSFASALDSLNLYSVILYTFAAHGPCVLTLNGVSHASLGDIPGTVVVDPYAATLEGQWKAHREAVASNGVQPALLDAEPAIERAVAQEQAQLDAQIARGRFVPAEDGTFQFSWAAAAALAAAIVAATRRVQDMRSRCARAQRAAKRPMSLPPLEEEVAAYKRHDEMTRAPARRSFFLWVFAVTLALFGVSLVTSRDAAVYGAIVTGVVLFHELGHYAAMRAFGYQDTTIFFIPFVGGAASGRKIDATLGQEIVVLLAGPLPGLIVAGAAALLGAGSVPRLNAALWALVGINLLNLLPILPLDGGRIVHALLFARNAWLDVVLRAVGVALLALLAITSSSPVLLGVTLLTALGIPHCFRLAALRRSFNQEVSKTPAQARVFLFFRTLHEKGHGALPFATKMMLARGVLVESSRTAAPGFASISLWLIAYLGSLFAGIVAVVALVVGGSRARSPEKATVHWTPLAPLACPARWHRSRGTEASVPSPQVTSIAVFEDPATAAEAKQAIQGAVAGADARSLGRILFLGVGLDKANVALTDGALPHPVDEETLVTTYARAREERSARMAQMDRMALERGGTLEHISGESSALVAVQCTARGVAEARSVEDDLADYFAAAAALEIRPPWIGDVTASERRARHTYRIAWNAITASMTRSPRWLGLQSLWANLRRRLGRRESSPVAFSNEWVQHARAAIDERRAIEPLDDEVTKLALATVAFDKPEEARHARSELRERLGAVDESDQLLASRLLGRATRSNANVTTEIIWLSTMAAQTELPAFLHWLCSRSCSEPVLMLVPELDRPGDRAQARADAP